MGCFQWWVKAGVRRFDRQICRVAVAVIGTAILTGCAIAPGMRMEEPATIPADSATDSSSEVDAQVPITEIDLSLIQKISELHQQANRDQWSELIAKPQPYLLGVGDVLQINVWDHPEITAAAGAQAPSNSHPYDPPQGFVIDDGGNVQVPFGGSVHVSGMQVSQAQAAIYQSLLRFFKNPAVTVRVASYRAKEIYVDGEVHVPGVVPINDVPTTLSEAVSRAGGFNPTADQSRMVLVRNGISHQINLAQMLDDDINPNEILLRNGDLLKVPSRDDSGVYVMGEVNKPLTALPMKNGHLTLSDALSQASSINSTTADAAQLYVIRGQDGVAPQVFHLNARSPVAMVLANEFELQPKDVVYVDGNGLVRISRVLSLLLPAINAGLTGAVVAK